MAGIIFFKTAKAKEVWEFYEDRLGMKLWLDQGKCRIFASGNLQLGFCEAETAETQGSITFYYPQPGDVDAAFDKFKGISSTAPTVNPQYNIYHFWAKDPEGRDLEFQCFLPDKKQAESSALQLLNPESQNPRLLLSMLLPDAAMQALLTDFQVLANVQDRPLSRSELIAGLQDAEAVISLLSDQIDAEIMDKAPKLKAISNYAVGFNNIDLAAAKARNIAVCNTPGVLTESTADLAWALIMAAARQVVPAESFTRNGQFKGWKPLLFLGKDVHAATLGIVGMGRIGTAVARRGTGFGMKILYTANSDKDLDFDAERVELKRLLAESDIISLHLPLTDKTRYLIGKNEFDLMKEGAILINTARGAVVDESELIRRLKDKRIFAAGFDVYEHEPEIPPALLELENAVLLPHIGSASIETRTNMGLLAIANAKAVLEGKEPPARVV